jgi:hypothetical protein
LKGVLATCLTPFLGLSRTLWLAFPTGLRLYFSCPISSRPPPAVNEAILTALGEAKLNNLFLLGVEGLPSVPDPFGENADFRVVELGGVVPVLVVEVKATCD